MDVLRLDFEQWLEVGIRQGFVSPPTCNTHEGVPMTVFEENDWEEGEDPCIHILRLCESKEHADGVEMNNEWIQRWRKGAGY